MFRTRNSSAFTAAALIVLACVLSACGRKGSLDLPPSASNYQAAPGPLDDKTAVEPATAQGNVYQTDTNADKTVMAPKGPKKRIILDPILD